MRKGEGQSDYFLLGIIGLLVFAGFVALSSASVVLSQEHFGNTTYYLKHQLLYGLGVGSVAFFASQAIPYSFWKKVSLPILLSTLLLLSLVFIPGIGYGAGGAHRWIRIAGFSFQPSEFIKLGFLLYLATWFESRRHNLQLTSYGFIPFALMLGVVSLLLVAQPDIGTLGVIVCIAMSQFFIAGGTFKHVGMLIVGAGLALVILVALRPYRWDRIQAFLDPTVEPLGIGYQINQSLIAIGSGGILGKGLGHGVQKFHYLPEAMGDSIFATIGEEFGFVGALLLIALYALFAWRGILIASRAPDTFGRITAVGITAWVFGQASINIGAMTGILPLTGLPLPFVSYGGTALIATLAASGILLNISKHTVHV
ncbi:MAG: putative lipid II flippase FtsW [Parcubacteria group bacterium]|nr:putative lipid II flippase FtsW [Parcubacteria group bacterium]